MHGRALFVHRRRVFCRLYCCGKSHVDRETSNMTLYLIAAVLAVGLLVYLFFAMLRPEWF